jgi:uncharacterized protein (UPF0548 family)
MSYPVRAAARWFGNDRQKDVQYLQEWREAPLTYSPGQEIIDWHSAAYWNADHYEVVLGRDPHGDLFRWAAQLALHNRFYPKDVLTATGDYSVQNRPVRVGDYVLQRIRVLQTGGNPILEVLAMNQVTEVVEEARRAGFTYTTTAAHSEVGEWSAEVVWRDNDEVALIIDSISAPRPAATRFTRLLTRKLQLIAHRRCVLNFKAQLYGHALPAPEPLIRRPEKMPAEMMAVGMLFTAFLLSLVTFIRFSRKTW